MSSHTRRLSEQKSAELEDLVDATSLNAVLYELALICSNKADHLRSNWQDDAAARDWERAAGICETASDRKSVVEVSR